VLQSLACIVGISTLILLFFLFNKSLKASACDQTLEKKLGRRQYDEDFFIVGN
jgi:hypothetical protein